MKVCWALTNECNKNCKFCFRDKHGENLPLKENLEVLNNLVKLDVTKITYAGGEPLMYEDIVEITKASREKGIYNKLNTNGSLLNKDNIKKYLAYIDKIALSVDSSNDEENYFLGRGRSHFAHIKEIIPIIKQTYPQIKIEINTVLTGQTIFGLEDMYNALTEFNTGEITRWKLIRFYPFKEIPEDKKNLFQITDKEFQEIREKFSERDCNFLITFSDVDKVNSKNIVNNQGILESFKNNKKKYKDLKEISIISKSKYNHSSIEDFQLNTNLNLYKVFFEVAQTGSLSLASKKMLISQPAISRSIKKLEEELDVELFYRTITGMNLTDKGKELYGYVEDAYNSIKTGERSMIESKYLYKGKLIIGVPSHIASFFLFDKIKKFHLDYPEIEISIVSRPTSDLIKLIESHKLDFIIDTSPIDGNEKILYIEKLTDLDLCFVALKSQNYNKVINNMASLENYPLILPVTHGYHRKKLNDLALNYDVNFKNVVAIETSEMIKEAILQNWGIGYLIKDVVKRELENGTLEEIEIEEKLPKVALNIVYIEKYLTNIPKLFINNYLK